MKPFFIALPLAVIILACIVFLWQKSKPKILVTPAKALIDVPVEISISNLTPYEQIIIEASCKDKNNNIWLSRATFNANDKGVVNVGTQAPIFGSYKEIDPMGLFWSMVPTDKDTSKHTASKYTLNVCEVSLSVFSQNKLSAQKMIYRLPVSPHVEKRNIREQGITGTFFYPKNMKKGAGIIVVPGSGGGIPENTSQLLASHGYAVLALGYFAAEGLPKNLQNIPLEYFQNAMQWFKKQPQVDGNNVTLLGHSRGAELVLLLAATFPKEMAAIITYAAPHLVYGDFSPEEKAAWTFKKLPMPFMPNLSNEDVLNAVKEGHVAFHKGTVQDPFEDIDTFLYGMKKFHKNIEAATIPVESIRCPILLFSGEDDKMWPSTLSGNLIMERLDSKGSAIKRKHVIFPHAGHGINVFPYTPSTDLPIPIGPVWCVFGGTAEGNAHANKKSWEEVLTFLKKHL